LARLHLQQLVGIDGDRLGVGGRLRGDGRGDDLPLHRQALQARVDEAGAELVQIEDAADECDQRRQIEDDYAPRYARRRRLADAAQQLAHRTQEMGTRAKAFRH
jgi:hypothetical protein